MIIMWRMSRVITLPGNTGPSAANHLFLFFLFFPSPRSEGGGGGVFEGWQKGLEFQQFHFLARGFNIIFNLPCLITNMKLSAPAGANLGRNRTMCSSGCNFATSCWHPAKAGGGECNTFRPPEGQRHYLSGKARWEEGGHGASALHHVPIHHNVTQSHACQDSVCTLPGVRGVSESSVLLIKKWSQPGRDS